MLGRYDIGLVIYTLVELMESLALTTLYPQMDMEILFLHIQPNLNALVGLIPSFLIPWII